MSNKLHSTSQIHNQDASQLPLDLGTPNPHPQPHTQEVFREQEAAAFLQVSRITLQRLRLKGEVPFSRIGIQVRYTKSQLERFLASRERATITNC
ncbi:MAG: helix-turn-helix domain-containing protein [Acidobacteria bacterium]|nr:helix-turn-helix domain-containing protein [Acidobacteriota bacterium]